MTQFKLGKHPPKIDARTLRFGTYATPKLPAPPATRTWAKPITSWGMMKNDNYGDCTCAAAGHMIMDWTANARTPHKPVVVPDQKILDFYNHFANGNADAGANMLDVLVYWRKHGLTSHKIEAFVSLEPRNHVEAMDAVNLFGAAYIGVALPDSVVPPGKDPLTIPWVVPPQGPVGNAAPNPNNGHCIPAVGYDARNLYIVTWGQLKAMSWPFYDAYADEAFAVLSPDWFGPKAKAPVGFDEATLKQDLAVIDHA